MTQPGWYPDPSSPFFVRWWDGQRWLNEVRPMGPDRAGDVAEEAKTGRAASLALRAGAVLYAGEFLVNGLLLAPLWRAYRQWSDALQTNSQATLVLPRSAIAVNLLSSLFSLGLLVVGVMWIMWFHKAATVAAQAGVPARRSPGWAIGAWFIPIGNWWLPYQSAVDMFPPGHPGRQQVKRWWALWLATSLAALFVVIGSLISTAIGLALALVGAVLAFAAASAGKSVIDDVNRVHSELVRH